MLTSSHCLHNDMFVYFTAELGYTVSVAQGGSVAAAFTM